MKEVIATGKECTVIDYLKFVSSLRDVDVGETVVVCNDKHKGEYIKLSNSTIEQIELLSSMCNDVDYDGLWENRLIAEYQLWGMAVKLAQLRLSFKDMVLIGDQYFYDKADELIDDLRIKYHLTIEEVLRELLSENGSSDEVDNIIDNVVLGARGGCDSLLFPCFKGNEIEFNRLADFFPVENIGKLISSEEESVYELFGKTLSCKNFNYKEENKFLLDAARTAAERVLKKCSMDL